MRTFSQATTCSMAVLSLAAVAIPAMARPARNAPSHALDANAATTILFGATPRGEAAPVRAFSAVFSPNGRLIAAGTSDRRIRLFDGGTGQFVQSLDFGASAEGLAFSPDSRYLAGAADNRVAVWDVASGARLWQVAGGRGDAARLLLEPSVAYTPDGRTVAVAGQQDMTAGATAGAVALLDARTGRVRRVLIAHGEPVNGLAVSPDGRHIAGVTGSFESEHPEVFVWDAATGEEAWVSRADAGPLFAAAFSPDGRKLAVCGRAEDAATVTLWDAASGGLERALPHGETALAAAFAPDGHTLVTGGLNGTLNVWDPDSGKMRGSLRGATPLGVFSVSISPDGRRLATASDEGTVRVIRMMK